MDVKAGDTIVFGKYSGQEAGVDIQRRGRSMYANLADARMPAISASGHRR